MRILLVEDDKLIAEILEEFLTDNRYVVDVVGDGEAALEQAIRFDYDLILLDLMLPKLDGVQLCRQLRDRGNQIPILMLTACDTSSDKVRALDTGADDYVVKPFNLQELLARIRALLRRGQILPHPLLEWGQLHLNPACYEVSYNNQPLRLTPKEYKLLEFLIRNGRRIASRSLMLEYLWSQDEPPTEDVIKAHIKTLRQKLKAVGAPGDFIETIHGMGYRLKEVQTGS